MATPRFRFDRQLWERFITIAQPYFYPNGTLPAWKGRVLGFEAFLFKFLALVVLGLITESLIVWGVSQGATPPWDFLAVITNSWRPIGIAGLAAVVAMAVGFQQKNTLRDWVIFKPVDSNTWIFFHLLGILVFGIVVPIAFLLVLVLTLSALALAPEFFPQVASGLVARVESWLETPEIIYAALITIGLSFIGFLFEKNQINDRWRPWVVLGVLLLLLFSVTGVNVVISYVARFLDNTLSNREREQFWQYLSLYGVVIVTAIPVLAVYVYTREKLGRFWRQWLTNRFLDQYFGGRLYYKLDSNSANTEIDNPDQRITQDVKSFTETTLSFLLDILNSFLDLLAFTGILYSISKALTLGLIAYAVIGTILAVLIGQRLIGINFNQLRLEADFRYGMIHIRDNAESIAFYQGESKEKAQLLERFKSVLINFDSLIIWSSVIYLYQRYYRNLTRFPPYLIVAPLYFAGERDFGEIAQSIFAFTVILDALSIITNRFNTISEFAAGINRLGDLYDVLEHPERLNQQDSHVQQKLGKSIALKRLTLLTPNAEQTLVRDLSLQLEPEQNLLVVGPSGCGKSSLLRAVGGLWDNGSGSITRPDLNEMLFLPQKPYMLLGTLRDQLLYPHNRPDIPLQRLQEALDQANLSYIVEQVGGWDVEKDWSNTLSLGEQQRLAFARILLSKPRYVILDEATSALDVNNERLLYEQLQGMKTAYLSVGHRLSLLKYHQLVLSLQEDASWSLISPEAYAAAQVADA